jgi:hypothetical protein
VAERERIETLWMERNLARGSEAYGEQCRLFELLGAGAYLDAAMMCIPADLRLVVLCDLAAIGDGMFAAKLGNRFGAGGQPSHGGKTPALALISAIEQAVQESAFLHPAPEPISES